MTRNRVYAAGFVLCLLAAGAGAADDPVETRIRAFETGLRPAVQVQGQPAERWTVQQRLDALRIPAVSVAVIRGGKLAWAKAYGLKQAGTAEAPDGDTVFSVGSVSKVAAATIALRLVDAGTLSLDRDVNQYLRRWQIPQNQFNADRPVTLRMLLSHTGGLSVSGFPDFQPDEKLPGVLDTLDGRPPSKTEPVRVMFPPGSAPQYSGGGTTVVQLLIEDVTGKEFDAVARELLFQPLGMNRSTFANPLPASHGNIARAHDAKGAPTALPRGWETMPELAASGLWTTPSDYARLVIALLQSNQGAPGALLRPETAREMMTPVGPSRVGLGPFIDGRGLTRRFSHSGSNDSYKAWMEGHLATGDGLVIFTNGERGNLITREIRRAAAAAEGWTNPETVEVPKVQLSSVELQAMTGKYAVLPARSTSELRLNIQAAPKRYVVTLDAGQLYFGVDPGTQREALIPEDPTVFVPAGDAARRIEFVRDAGGRIRSLVHRDGDFAVEAVRQAP